MKRLAAAVIGFCLVCAAPADALRLRHYVRDDVIELQAAAKTGDVEAMITLGNAYASGRVPGGADKASAIYWLRTAADLGSAEAQRDLGYFYDSADYPGHRRDETRAFLWFKRAAEKGDVFAQGRLAGIYETSATLRDYRKGYQWNLKAALQGDPTAADRIRTLYVYKDEVTSFDAAVERLSAAADAGDKTAQWRLATVLMAAMATPEEGDRARDVAEKSALQDSPEGLYLLANYLPPGTSGFSEAARVTRLAWLRKAADMGYVPAQLEWISDYETPAGIDPTQDPNERLIFDWYAAAAEKGWPVAQNALRHYYARGLFVPQDGAEARKWLLLAHHLPYYREGFLSAANPWREPVEEDWQAEGRRRAEAWLKAHPKLYWQDEE